MGLLKSFSDKKNPEPRYAATVFGDMTTPGGDAIDYACARLYRDQPNPLHVSPTVKYHHGGPDPLAGVSIYNARSPRAHWHYISYGFSDLYGAQDAESESGYGFELTFRLADESAMTGGNPPLWPVTMMQNLARYVFETGNIFGQGHHFDANGPITNDTGTRLRAVGFTLDPDLGEIETPYGRLAFLQILGLTTADLSDAMAWQGKKFFKLLMSTFPKGVTIMDRDSLRADPDLSLKIVDGQDRDGSNLGAAFLNALDFIDIPLTVVLERKAAQDLRNFLSRRLPRGEAFTLLGPTKAIQFSLASFDDVIINNENFAQIQLSHDTFEGIQQELGNLTGDVQIGPILWRVI